LARSFEVYWSLSFFNLFAGQGVRHKESVGSQDSIQIQSSGDTVNGKYLQTPSVNGARLIY
jgi:hypothetical protein